MSSFFLVSFLSLRFTCGIAEILDSKAGSTQSQQSSGQESYPSYESFEPQAQKELFARLKQIHASEKNGEKVAKTPIFVITCDRISVLIKSLLSYYTRIDAPVEVIIHDNHTTYPPTKDFLDRLEQEGITVYRSDRDITHDRALSDLSATIADWYTSHDAPYYVVTDPDIEIEEESGDILSILMFLLDESRHMNVAGPMLRRDDLPDHYPLKNYVQVQQSQVYLGMQTWNMQWNEKNLVVQDGWIDTCFGMYRKGFIFHNYNKALQTYHPYQARHLDWYIDPNNLAADQVYYLERNNPVGHWSSTLLRRSL